MSKPSWSDCIAKRMTRPEAATARGVGDKEVKDFERLSGKLFAPEQEDGSSRGPEAVAALAREGVWLREAARRLNVNPGTLSGWPLPEGVTWKAKSAGCSPSQVKPQVVQGMLPLVAPVRRLTAKPSPAALQQLEIWRPSSTPDRPRKPKLSAADLRFAHALRAASPLRLLSSMTSTPG